MGSRLGPVQLQRSKEVWGSPRTRLLSQLAAWSLSPFLALPTFIRNQKLETV